MNRVISKGKDSREDRGTVRTLDCDMEEGWEPVRAGGGEVKGDWTVAEILSQSRVMNVAALGLVGSEGRKNCTPFLYLREKRLTCYKVSKREHWCPQSS